MADFGKPKNSIPAWQRTQKPLGPETPSSSHSASQLPSSGSTVASQQESEENKAITEGSQPSPDVPSVGHFKTDGSDEAAKQEHDASKAVPSSLRQTEEAPNNVAKTDGTITASQQEFNASKAFPDSLRDSEEPLSNALATDGSDEAAKQEFEASQQVIDQVRKFLSDPQVKDAPLEKKRSFLESKSVPKEIITQVLEVETPAIAFSAAEFQTSLQPTRPPALPQRELPPIVTYPEFLMQPQQPPPLVTINRLVSAAYITGGIAATIYGLSKFIVSPMSANLSDARHEFASHTSEHLVALNDKLSNVVSTVPASSKSKSNGVDEFDDAESNASDPTELFHRDIGTQTSAPPSPSEKAASAVLEPETPLSKQEKRLQIMKSHMSELLADSETNGTTTLDIQGEVAEFRQYLDTLVYSPPAYQYMPGDSVWTPPGTPGGKKSDDIVKDFKAEIRGVKGVLLSAKRFPSATVVR